MRGRRGIRLVVVGILAATMMALAACEVEEPTATPPVFDPTPAPPLDTPTPAEPVDTPVPPNDVENGDPASGEAIFTGRGGCSACHTLTEDALVGPGLAGISERGAERIPGVSPEDYIREAITDPRAFTVEGFPDIMPPPAQAGLSPEDIEDLVAFLLTQ